MLGKIHIFINKFGKTWATLPLAYAINMAIPAGLVGGSSQIATSMADALIIIRIAVCRFLVYLSSNHPCKKVAVSDAITTDPAKASPANQNVVETKLPDSIVDHNSARFPVLVKANIAAKEAAIPDHQSNGIPNNTVLLSPKLQVIQIFSTVSKNWVYALLLVQKPHQARQICCSVYSAAKNQSDPCEVDRTAFF